MDRVAKLKVNQQQRLTIGGSDGDVALGVSNPLASQFLTGDQNIIQMQVVVQYVVSAPVVLPPKIPRKRRLRSWKRRSLAVSGTQPSTPC